jgi:transposase
MSRTIKAKRYNTLAACIRRSIGNDIAYPLAVDRRFGKTPMQTFLSSWVDILAKRADVLSPRMVRIVAELAGDWRRLDERIETVTDEIEALAKSDDSCRRVMTVPGIGPIIHFR